MTFQLSDVRELDRFKDLTLAKKGMAGQRLAAVMMQYEDDAEPAPVVEKAKPGMLCIMACTFCADPMFMRWIEATNENEAKQYILNICGIASRKELDSQPSAAKRFHAQIREPYMAWRADQ